MTNYKKQLLAYCESYVQDRINRFSGAISEAQSGANNETKSSAGDKHETGRAMAQLETENNAKHLAEAKKLQAVLSQIDPDKECETVELGALVETDKGWFFVAIGAGKTTINGQVVFLVSAASPIAQAMIGKKEGDDYRINNQPSHLVKIS